MQPTPPNARPAGTLTVDEARTKYRADQLVFKNARTATGVVKVGFRKPNFLEWQGYQRGLIEADKRSQNALDAGTKLTYVCCVTHTADELKTIIDEEPGLPNAACIALANLVTSLPEDEAEKKVD